MGAIYTMECRTGRATSPKVKYGAFRYPGQTARTFLIAGPARWGPIGSVERGAPSHGGYFIGGGARWGPRGTGTAAQTGTTFHRKVPLLFIRNQLDLVQHKVNLLLRVVQRNPQPCHTTLLE